MAKIEVDKDKCKGCRLCIQFCPKKCIKMSKEFNKSGYNYAVFEGSDCTGCTFCYLVCPDYCIEVYK